MVVLVDYYQMFEPVIVTEEDKKKYDTAFMKMVNIVKKNKCVALIHHASYKQGGLK